MEEVDGPCLGKPKELEENNHLSETDVNDIDDNDVNNTNNNEDIAVVPVSQHDYYYKMDHNQRGLLLVFNHEKFDKETGQPTRKGTDKDVEKIKKTFDDALRFETHVFNDMTLTEIRMYIKKYVTCDYYNKQRDCLAVFVLTHGDKDLVWARDTCYDPSVELWGQFTAEKCPSLAGKPKLVFIQSCQGQAFDKGVKVQLPIRRQTETDGSLYHSTFPVYADFLICYASFEGFFAFRNDVVGSFWVTVLCEELKAHYRKTDLLTILTFVNRRMIDYSSYNTKDAAKHNKKQISYFKSSLTRLLVFGEK